MTKEKYAERKAKGLCLGSEGCSFPPRKGKKICAPCWELRKAAMRAYRQRRKEAGLCAYSGCKEKVETTMCPRHQGVQTSRERAWHDRNRKRVRRFDRERKESRARLGLCIRCPRPLHTQWLCMKCAEHERQRGVERRRAQGAKPDVKRCSTCRQPGHRYTTCPERFNVEVDVGEYASARREWV